MLVYITAIKLHGIYLPMCVCVETDVSPSASIIAVLLFYKNCYNINNVICTNVCMLTGGLLVFWRGTLAQCSV